MHKLLVFDLDGTLAMPAKGMTDPDVQKLLELEKSGYIIAICSGKTSYYLCGFARQLGLKNPILLGENGGTIQFGIDLPPKKYVEYPRSEKAKEQIRRMKDLIDKKFPGKIWYQPNLIGISPFPADEETFSALQELINQNSKHLSELLIYRHWDCFDLIPKNVNKKNGLIYLSEISGIEASDMIAIGDGVNDVPMFEYADISIGVMEKADNGDGLAQGNVQNPIETYIDYSFATIGEVLDFILEKHV